jgi:hypothetical protein
MELGMKRELNASFDKDNIWIYFLGERGVSKTYFSMYRSVFMKIATYNFGTLWAFNNLGKMDKYRLLSVSIPETEQSLIDLVDAIHKIQDTIERKGYQEKENGEEIVRVVQETLEEYFPKNYWEQQINNS